MNRRLNPCGLFFRGSKNRNFYTGLNAAKIGAEKKCPLKMCLKPPFLLNFSLSRKQVNYKKRKAYGRND